MTTTPPRSHQLAAGSTTTAGALVDIYTCPTGKVVILKTMTVWSRNLNDLVVIVAIQTGGVGLGVWATSNMGGLDTKPFELGHVLEEGDILQLYVDPLTGGDHADYVVSGSILSNT